MLVVLARRLTSAARGPAVCRLLLCVGGVAGFLSAARRAVRVRGGGGGRVGNQRGRGGGEGRRRGGRRAGGGVLAARHCGGGRLFTHAWQEGAGLSVEVD